MDPPVHAAGPRRPERPCRDRGHRAHSRVGCGDRGVQPPLLLRSGRHGPRPREGGPQHARVGQEGGLRRPARGSPGAGDGRHPRRSRHRLGRAPRGCRRRARGRRAADDGPRRDHPPRPGLLRPRTQGSLGRRPPRRGHARAGDPGRAVGHGEGVAAQRPLAAAVAERPAARHGDGRPAGGAEVPQPRCGHQTDHEGDFGAAPTRVTRAPHADRGGAGTDLPTRIPGRPDRPSPTGDPGPTPDATARDTRGSHGSTRTRVALHGPDVRPRGVDVEHREGSVAEPERRVGHDPRPSARPRPLPRDDAQRGREDAASVRARRARARPPLPAGLGTRSRVRHRLPRPSRRAAGAGHRAAVARPGRPALPGTARPHPPAVALRRDRRRRGWAVRPVGDHAPRDQ